MSEVVRLGRSADEMKPLNDAVSRIADEVGIRNRDVVRIITRGYAIVPAASVVSEADRAAVGRVTEVAARHQALRNARMIQGSLATNLGVYSDGLNSAASALQPTDIEAAQRVADGGA